MDQTRLDAIRARCDEFLEWLEDGTEFREIEKHGKALSIDVLDMLAEVARLTAELIAAKRDLRHADNCDICAHAAAPGSCDLECDECKRGCFCRDCRDENLWQWRGPTENRGQLNE